MKFSDYPCLNFFQNKKIAFLDRTCPNFFAKEIAKIALARLCLKIIKMYGSVIPGPRSLEPIMFRIVKNQIKTHIVFCWTWSYSVHAPVRYFLRSFKYNQTFTSSGTCCHGIPADK